MRHIYVGTPLVPLDLFTREADPEAAREAVIDYGYAIKDLVAHNIFPGDMLLKNFGVTRNRRVVFYDYDELCLLTDCNFREIPPPTNWADDSPRSPGTPSVKTTFSGRVPPSSSASGPAPRRLRVDSARTFDVNYWRAVQNRIP